MFWYQDEHRRRQYIMVANAGHRAAFHGRHSMTLANDLRRELKREAQLLHWSISLPTDDMNRRGNIVYHAAQLQALRGIMRRHGVAS